MMLSATDFFPACMSTLTNLATSTLKYFGSGKISRFGISLRRGMYDLWLFLSLRSAALRPIAPHLGGLRPLGAVLRAPLLAILDARRVQAAAHDVVAHA